jgi:Domain of Unknown Function (DUF928)
MELGKNAPMIAVLSNLLQSLQFHLFHGAIDLVMNKLSKWSGLFGTAVILASGLSIAIPGQAEAVQFKPSSKYSAPRQTTGGASRGQVKFRPNSRNGAPRQSVGGASRGVKFMPAPGRGSVRSSYGGASRGVLFTPKKGKGTPRRSDGGASRTNVYGGYNKGDEPLSMQAMTPENFFGTTLEARPTIMVYLPESDAKEAVFTLKDNAKNLHYQMTLPVSGQAGVMVLQLPSDAPELKLDQDYQWYVALKVEQELVPGTPFVDGWVKRISATPELTQQLAGQSNQKQAEILATEGIWYDSAAKLAQAYKMDSKNGAIAQDWKDLLGSVNLTEIADPALLVQQ